MAETATVDLSLVPTKHIVDEMQNRYSPYHKLPKVRKPKRYEHLIHRIPNLRFTRWVVHLLNKRMAQSGSKYKLFIRYRVPRRGFKYGFHGKLACSEAKRFSVYIRTRS